MEVESSNERRLKALPGKSYRFDAFDFGEPAIREKLLQNMMAPKTLELKKGAQVMLIKNMDETLVNGSLGTVTGFMTENTFELTGGIEDDGSDVETDSKIKKRIKAFSKALDSSATSDAGQYPMVKFHAVDGTERILLCVPEEWKVELPNGDVQASRKQLPLILAWALSIHKAQGQTLERVKVDLGRVFEKGQAYVALSRATTQQGLQVLRFQKDKVMAHPRVVGFYNKLYSAEHAVKKTTTPSISSFATRRPTAAEPSSRYGHEVIDLDEDPALADYA
jgi:ATP-dependent DNA helicase PIF1